MIRSSDYDTIIKPRAGINQIDWRDLWRYRELAYILVWRDIKVRYKQTIFGAAWAVFQPFVSMIVFSVFFGTLVKVPSDNLPYPIFVYAGLLPWTFFSNGLNRASNSLHSESNLISKIYFPRIIVPISSLGAGILDLVIAFIFMLAMMGYYRVYLGLSMLLLLPLFLIIFLVSMGMGTLLATLSVTYRDVKYVTPFLIQLWMYASPVIYPVSIVPEKWRWLLSVNPMSGLIDGCRSAFFGKPFDWPNIGISTAVSFALVLVGLIYFKITERRFADII
jgi:lipopolysaccharide transport system permease protein